MFARIGTWQGTAEELEQWIARGREQVKPSILQDGGLRAVYWLADRKAGKGMIVTTGDDGQVRGGRLGAGLGKSRAGSSISGTEELPRS